MSNQVASVKNIEGWQLNLLQNGSVEICDKWGIPSKEPTLFIGKIAERDKGSLPSSLLNKEVVQLLDSGDQRFGFQVHRKNGMCFVVFGNHGLKGGGGEEDRETGKKIGIVILGVGGGLLFCGPALLGAAVFGFGGSLLRYAINTDAQDYNHRRALEQGFLGAAGGAIAQKISSSLESSEGSGLMGQLAAPLVAPLTSTALQTLCLEGRAPTAGEIATSLVVSGAGGLAQAAVSRALAIEGSGLVLTAINGAVSGAASGGASKAVSNYLQGKPLNDRVTTSAAIGAFEGAVYRTRGYLDKDAAARAKFNQLRKDDNYNVRNFAIKKGDFTNETSFNNILKEEINQAAVDKKHMITLHFQEKASFPYQVLLQLGFELHHGDKRGTFFTKCLSNHAETCGYPKFQTAYPAVTSVVFNETGDKVLLIQEDRGPTQGRWKPPTGSIETGETPVEAAVRELYEETGIRVKKEDAVSTGYYYAPNFRGDAADMNWHFAFKVPENVETTPQEKEIRAITWMPVDEYLKLSEGYVKPSGKGQPAPSWTMPKIVELANKAMTNQTPLTPAQCAYLSGKPVTVYGTSSQTGCTLL